MLLSLSMKFVLILATLFIVNLASACEIPEQALFIDFSAKNLLGFESSYRLRVQQIDDRIFVSNNYGVDSRQVIQLDQQAIYWNVGHTTISMDANSCNFKNDQSVCNERASKLLSQLSFVRNRLVSGQENTQNKNKTLSCLISTLQGLKTKAQQERSSCPRRLTVSDARACLEQERNMGGSFNLLCEAGPYAGCCFKKDSGSTNSNFSLAHPADCN